MTEKPRELPLHVKVAEVLGWSGVEEKLEWNGCVRKARDGSGEWEQDVNPVWRGAPATGAPAWYGDMVPRYDTDWSATGPLIEKYRICIEAGLHGGHHSKPWSAWLNRHSPAIRDYDGEAADGPTPLIAVCRLLLALHEGGKL